MFSFYNPKNLFLYQTGGAALKAAAPAAAAQAQHQILNEIEILQQQVTDINQLIEEKDYLYHVDFDENGLPTGEIIFVGLVPVGRDTYSTESKINRILQEQIYARDFLQSKLDNLNLKVKKIQSLYRGNKSRLSSKAVGKITTKQKRKDWPKIRQSMLDEGFTEEQIQSFYDNIYMASHVQRGGNTGYEDQRMKIIEMIDKLVRDNKYSKLMR